MISSEPAVSNRRQQQELDVAQIRADFPILSRKINGKPLVYLDSAASSQKPNRVIDAISRYYREYHANVHRGVHTLSQEATAAYEGARETLRCFVNAAKIEEMVYVRGTTEGINLVAACYGGPLLKKGDRVLVSHMEHHSNIVPWQMLCSQTGAELKVIPIDDRGQLRLDGLDELLNQRTKIVAVSHVSNALGTINPIRQIGEKAHAMGAVLLVDGAQAVPHMRVDVRALDCDFYLFSSHKMFGPTGIGMLYGKQRLLEKMSPYQGGGDMIKSVSFEHTVYNDLPYKFEAGTPNIAGAVGFAEAVKYIENIGIDAITAYERQLLTYGTQTLSDLPGLRLIGTAKEKASVLSFVLDYAHPHDAGTILDRHGIAVRTGHHCAQPVMQRFQVPATIRASLALYNTREEIDLLVKGLETVRRMFT